MTPYERLLQEAIPVKLERPDGKGLDGSRRSHSLWTQEEQDRHWDDLCRAVGAPNRRKHPPRAKKQRADSEAAA